MEASTPSTVVTCSHFKINAFEAKIFYHWAGDKEFNPMAIIFGLGGKVKEVRFWQGFRDYKHGREKALKSSIR